MCRPETAAAAPTAATDATRLTRVERFLLAEAQRWDVKVHRNFDSEEVRLVLECGGMRAKSSQEIETITPQGILTSKERLPRRRTCALATFPFTQRVPMSQARRYLSRDTGCSVMNDTGDGSVALVQASVVDLADGWYRGCERHTLDGSDDCSAFLQRALDTEKLQTAGIDPEAVRQFRIMARKVLGAEADEQPMIVCARRCQNPGLVFVGRAEDIHLFLRNDAVRKELGIADWTQRGYTARDRKSSYIFNFGSKNTEVELGSWDEMIVMYRDDSARTLTTVQPLWQFKRERQLGEEILDAT